MTKPDCENCPLNGRQPVEGVNLKAKKLVVFSYPGMEEVAHKDPRSGPGTGLVARLAGNVGYTTAVQCFPGEVKTGGQKKALEEARKCCLPRLEHEMKGRRVLACGEQAIQSTTGKKIAVTKARGEVLGNVHPTLSPNYVLRRGGEHSQPGMDLRGDVENFLSGRQKVSGRVLVDPPIKSLKLPKKGSPVVVDIETTGLSPYVAWDGVLAGAKDRTPLDPELRPADVGELPKIRCWGFCWNNEEAVVFTKENSVVRKLLSGDYELVAQNYPFEKQWFEAHGPTYPHGKGPGPWVKWHDTMHLAHARYEDRGPRNYGLDALTRDLLKGVWPSKKELLGKYNVLTAPLDVLAVYCGWDCIKEWRLFVQLLTMVKTEHVARAGAPSPMDRLHNVVMPAAPFLDEISRRGIPFDLKQAAKEVAGVRNALAEVEGVLLDFADINWGSDKQIIEVFKHHGLNATHIRTPSGLPSLSKEARPGLLVLNPDHREILEAYDSFQGLQTLLSRFEGEKGCIAMTGDDGRLHPRFHLAGPKTGRLSASSPAVQTYDAPIKRCIRARRGYSILEVDYDGAEVLWMALLSRDPGLLEIVRSGASLHSIVAEQLGIPRFVAKTTNFLIGYGGGAKKLKANLDSYRPQKGVGITYEQACEAWGRYSLAECKSILHRRLAMFPVWARYTKEVEALAVANGVVYSAFGAARRVPGAKLPNGPPQWDAKRQAVNHMMQNPASDVNLMRALQVHRELPDVQILTLTHDSILFETKAPYKAARAMKSILEDPEFYWGTMDPAPTVSFKCGPSWGEMKEMKV